MLFGFGGVSQQSSLTPDNAAQHHAGRAEVEGTAGRVHVAPLPQVLHVLHLIPETH